MENDLKGNENYFELTGCSRYRGFELPGFDCIIDWILWLSHVEFSCMIEGPFSRLIFIHVAPPMNQIKLSRSRLLCSVDVLTFKRSRIFGLSFMICTAA